MQNMHLQLQTHPTRIIWFWKETVLPAVPTFQASQSRFSLCLFQNNLCAVDWLCVCCYSSRFIWLMTLLGDGCHEPPTNIPFLLLEKVPFMALLKRVAQLKNSWGPGLNTATKYFQWSSEVQRGRGRNTSHLQSSSPTTLRNTRMSKKPLTLQLHVM